MRAGEARDAAELSAVRQANNIGGNLPKAEMNQIWHQILGGALFSRGYSSTVVRQATSAITKDKILMARLQRRGYTPEAIAKLIDQNREDIAKGLVLDYAHMLIWGNLINYAMTMDGKTKDRNGEYKPHFAWDNPSKDGHTGKPSKSEYLFPDRISMGLAKDGNPAYMENPLRTMRDIILFFLQGWEVASGEKPTWLNRKLGFVGLGKDMVAGVDASGRPIRDPLDRLVDVAGRVTPFDLHAPAEAIRMNSLPYFTDALSGALSDPLTTGLKLGGLQPHEETGDAEAAQYSRLMKEEAKVRAEASEIKKNWPRLSPQARKDAMDRLEKIGEPLGMKFKREDATEISPRQRKQINKAGGFFEEESQQ
jgi:hypothetical protein